MIAGCAFSVSLSSSSGPVAHQPEQVLAERLVDLVEHVARGAARLGQRGAHADRLAALPRKKECAHRSPLLELCVGARLGRRGAIAKAAGRDAMAAADTRQAADSSASG